MNVLTTLKNKAHSLYTKSKGMFTAGKVAIAGAAAGSTVLPGMAHAAGDIDDLFAAVNITGVSASVKALMISFIGIAVLFLGYALVKKTTRRGA